MDGRSGKHSVVARKLRLEYAGAVYHVISRGNYRADVFGSEPTKAAFLTCVGEAAEKAGWSVHAWCVMSNHYHLCFTTPRPNLVEGMRWLQATFAIRFNRLRNERGHLFQGRYKALPVEPDAAGAVCHYIHLNPVRARVAGMDALGAWPWTSVPALLNPRRRAQWFSPEPALAHAGGLSDTPADRRRYLAYLRWLQADGSGQKALEFDRMSKDWAVGPREFKKELLRVHGELASGAETPEAGPRELSRELWEERIGAYLAAVQKGATEIAGEAKGARWKVAVAAAMKAGTTASNPWLADRLRMGSPFRLCRLAGECRADPTAFEPYVTAIAKCKV
jgi:REP element-mobilizing transposase RayT